MSNWTGRMMLLYEEPATLSDTERQKLGQVFDQAWPRFSEQIWNHINIPNCKHEDLLDRISDFFTKSLVELCNHPNIKNSTGIIKPFSKSTWRKVGNLHVGENGVEYRDANGRVRPFELDFGGVAMAEVFVRIEFHPMMEAT